jgi:hypothetical protein
MDSIQKSLYTWDTVRPRQHITLRNQLEDEQIQALDQFDPMSIFGLVAVAIFIGVTAQSFINSMIAGDQGLGAFLSDGNGFSNSKFKPLSRKTIKADPLPWLKLPKLDFVEVAGQDDEENEMKSIDRLELVQSLMQRMEKELQMGDTQGASRTKDYIDSLLNESETDKINFK